MTTASGAGRSERELADARFRVAVEGSPSGMLLADAQGRIVMANRQVERLFGYSHDELLGRPVEVLVPGRFRPAHERHRAAFAAQPEVRPMGAGRDLAGVRKDGTEFPVEIGLNPLETDEGPMVLASIVDISGQQALERQLAHAEKLNALGQLSAGVAHEINTPLSNISLLAESVLRRSTDESVRQKMDGILAQVDASSRIVNGLLEFSRRREPLPTRVDLGEAIEATVEFVRAKVPGEVELSFDRPAESLLVLGDSGQLHQVFTNLFLNASEAMDGHGVVRTSVSFEPPTTSRPPAGDTRGRVVVTVEDSGPGIPPSVLPHIFEPFFTTKSDRGGTGLGLSVVHGIVRSMGGQIEASNADGAGARFRIRLPRA